MFRMLQSALLACLAMLGLSSMAMAQSKVLVVDTNAVIAKAQVGQHVQAEIQKIADQIKREVEAESGPAAKEFETFAKQLEGMTREQLQGRQDLQQKAVELEGKRQDIARSSVVKQRELVATRAKALEPVGKAIDEILDSIVKEQKADILVERELVYFVSSQADITDLVVQRLDAKMKTVRVERVRAPATPG
jgi:Skp family chaperone for outer membrane proteins